MSFESSFSQQVGDLSAHARAKLITQVAWNARYACVRKGAGNLKPQQYNQ